MLLCIYIFAMANLSFQQSITYVASQLYIYLHFRNQLRQCGIKKVATPTIVDLQNWTLELPQLSDRSGFGSAGIRSYLLMQDRIRILYKYRMRTGAKFGFGSDIIFGSCSGSALANNFGSQRTYGSERVSGYITNENIYFENYYNE